MMMGVRVIISVIAVFVLMKYPNSLCLDIRVYPSTVCYQEHEDLVLRCTFDDHNTSTAKFKFKPRDRPDTVYELKSVIVNSDTIETSITDVTILNNTGTYFCTRDSYNKRQITYIEERVVLPDHVQCYFDESHLSVICEWLGGNATCWSLSIVNAGMGVYEKEKACNVSTVCNGLSPLAHCVQARYETKTRMNAVCPVSFPGKKAIDLKLTGVKLTSTASKIIHKVIDCSSVKLSVSAAHIQNDSSTYSVLAWRTDGSSLKKCDCNIQCVITTSNSTPITVNQKCSADNLFMVKLKNLQESKMYSSEIRCKVIGSEVWSDTVDINFTTPYTAPLSGPIVGPGGYDMFVCHKKFYCLVLYWKVLKEDVSGFKILVSDRTQKYEFDVPNSSVGKLRIPKTSSCQRFNVSIFSVNSVGKSQNATFLQVVDRFCSQHRPISCIIRYSNNSHGYTGLVNVNAPCLKYHSCDIAYYWCQGTKHDSYVECQNYVKWTKANHNVSATVIPIQQRKANGTVYIGAVVSRDGQSPGIDWDICQESTENTRCSSKSYIFVIIPLVVVFAVLTLLGTLIRRRGGLKKKLWNVLKKCSMRNVTSVSNNQGDPPTLKGTPNALQMSDVQPQSVEGYYEPVCSNTSHSVLSTDTSNHNLNAESSTPISDLDRSSQTSPKSVCSIIPKEKLFNGRHTEEATYMDVNALCPISDDSETDKKTIRDDYGKVDDFDGFLGNSETFEKEIEIFFEDTNNAQKINNLDYTRSMEGSEEFSPNVSMCSNRSIYSEESNSKQQTAEEDNKIPHVLPSERKFECEDIPMVNQNENKEEDFKFSTCVKPICMDNGDPDSKDPDDDQNAAKDLTCRNNRKSDMLLQNDSKLSEEECNDYVKAEGPIRNDFITGEFDYVVMEIETHPSSLH